MGLLVACGAQVCECTNSRSKCITQISRGGVQLMQQGLYAAVKELSLRDGAMLDHSFLVHLHLPGATALVPALLRVERGHVAVSTLGQRDLEACQIPSPTNPSHIVILVLSPATCECDEAVTTQAEGKTADADAFSLSALPLL